MTTLTEYMDMAKARGRFGSDRQLAMALGISANAQHHWRHERTLPSDGQMVRLAGLAGLDPGTALLDLNAWRTKSETARATYATLRDLVSKHAVTGALALALLGVSGHSEASDKARTGEPHNAGALYIMENNGYYKEKPGGTF